MKILEIEINEIRGIRKAVIQPDGNNFLIWGKNGSGKSGTIDAIDFLLTGKINRLTGKGTKGINLSEYGPHIDEKQQRSYVQALIKLNNINDPILIRREFKNPKKLIVKDKL